MNNPNERAALETLSLEYLFGADVSSAWAVKGQHFQRRELQPLLGKVAARMDTCTETESSCCFLRYAAAERRTVRLGVSGGYQVDVCPSGGWLLKPSDLEHPAYWIPQPLMVRALDQDGHILSQGNAELIGFRATASDLALEVSIPSDRHLDFVIWRLPPSEQDMVAALEHPLALESLPIFMWSSHTVYQRPADVYSHLVYGHVYENHTVWPRYWKVCSELDAYALYVTVNGLEQATGKRLYSLLKRQVVFSVIARQAEDGGWYHGEWTDHMEAHYRLHCGAMHLLAAAFEQEPDDAVRSALEKAAAYISNRSTKIDAGVWYLHDSLEQSPESAKLYPFRRVSSGAFGKAPTNMLVLNTHLDTMIALDRYREVTGSTRYEEEVTAARNATRAVLKARPAEWLYRPLFWAIGLTFLPTTAARRLPLPMRALKRVGWKYLIPWLPRIKALFPRLVMPGGHIERALSQRSWSDQYQSVTVMDLLRYRRRFSNEDLGTAVDEALAFTHTSGIRERWKEVPGKGHALGFWVEALYHLCLSSQESRYRKWLAAAILDVEDQGLGLSPSLLGANGEAVVRAAQVPCPSPVCQELRIVNLSHGDSVEFVVVNPTAGKVDLVWESDIAPGVVWRDVAGTALDGIPAIYARGWLWGRNKASLSQPFGALARHPGLAVRQEQ